MPIDVQNNNNLIARTISTTKNSSIEKKTTSPVITNTAESRLDSVELSKHKENKSHKPNKLKPFIDAFTSGLIIAGIFFLPDIITAIKNKKISYDNKKYSKFKPLIENITSQKQEQLSKGRIKTTLEAINDNFVENEILIMDTQGRITQRVLIKKEEMPDGKEVIRKIITYVGKDLSDNLELRRNQKKYLFKEYNRTAIINNQSSINIKVKDKDERNITMFSTNYGEPVLKIEEKATQKENTLYLYDNDLCVGTDTQIINKNTHEQYNIINIPEKDIYQRKCNSNQDSSQYDKSLMNKFLANF